jgi:hypothetical protein
MRLLLPRRTNLPRNDIKMKNIQIVAVVLLALFQFNCKDNKKEVKPSETTSEIKTDSVKAILANKNFDTIMDGKKVNLYWIKNKGIKAAFTNYGGRLIGLCVFNIFFKMLLKIYRYFCIIFVFFFLAWIFIWILGC